MFKPGDIVKVKDSLIYVNELYNDLQNKPLEIAYIVTPEHIDYDKSMEPETLYAFKKIQCTLYESEIESFSLF